MKFLLYTYRRKFSILIHIVFLLTACKNGQQESAKKVFRYNEEAGLSTLDPAHARDQAIMWGVNQLFNGLVQLDSDLNVMPCIARRWEVSDSGKTFTFYLRSDVYFHDNECFTNGKGRKVNAHDFVYSLGRVVNPETASSGAWIFNDKIDVKRYLSKEYTPFVAVNDSVFTISLVRPFPPFLSMLAMQYCFVVPKEAIDKYGNDFRTHPVGTGPFMFKLWEDEVKLVLVKNPNYFETENGKRLPYLDAVEFSFIENKQTAFMEFVQGRLDFFKGVESSFKDELLTKDGKLMPKYQDKFKLELNQYLNTEYIAFLQDTTANPSPTNPWYKKEVRQAINYAIDRKKMILFLKNNIGIPATSGFTPMGLPSFDNQKVKGYDYNPALASQLLKKAGYPQGQGLPPLVLNTNKNYVDIAVYIQKQLADIGIKVKVEVNPGPAHRTQVSKGRYQFFRGSWIADYPDAENYLSLFYSKNKAPAGPNYSRFEDKEADRLYEAALYAPNDSTRYELYRQMDQRIMDLCPVVVLYYDQSMRLVQPWVQGLQNNAMNNLVLKNVDIVKNEK